ncbi:hypothetical protein ZOSMA_26G01280 [Zostera marina]|uniref:C2H2-type domain-containing protein n=1 Tax=Zostera marina TaxID=29655 RepID=A0A0K9PE85_ZOSMR|nr:hypothetical protein ZOSMA_26G01280 [Zostera marina]
MDKHTCKLCSRRFANGRALGGHMRSHLATHVFHSSSSSSGFDQEDPDLERQETVGFVSYGLRENPRKSSRLVDPHFNVSRQLSSGVVLDGESETDSCRRTTTNTAAAAAAAVASVSVSAAAAAATSRRRSKRQWRRQSPVSCTSDATTSSDVDVAFCLIMLSQDSWDDDAAAPVVKRERYTEECRQSELSDYSLRAMSSFGSRKLVGKGKGKYVCVTCNKVFKSYQSLGGHRANHKKLKPPPPPPTAVAIASPGYEEDEEDLHFDSNVRHLKTSPIHECPVCSRVFKSAQALGGHKKAHFLSSSTATQIPTNLSASTNAITVSSSADAVKFERSFIDLNLPAPMEGDDAEIGSFRVDDSAVSCVG